MVQYTRSNITLIIVGPVSRRLPVTQTDDSSGSLTLSQGHIDLLPMGQCLAFQTGGYLFNPYYASDKKTVSLDGSTSKV